MQWVGTVSGQSLFNTIMRLLLYAGLVVFLWCPSVQANRERLFETVVLHWENDAFIGTDRDYTNGFKLTARTPFRDGPNASHLPRWSRPIIDRLPLVSSPEHARAVSFSVAQNIYTPEDTDRRDLIEDDRPYAGIILLSAGFHSKTTDIKNNWEFGIGILGPHSYAEDIQDWVHDLTHTRPAQGWDNQLEDELLIDIVFETQRRYVLSEKADGLSFDFIPHVGGRLGNVSIYLNVGAEARLGRRLPTNFGTCPIRPGCQPAGAFSRERGYSHAGRPLGFHLFVGVDGRGVLHDVTLDGNTVRDSHQVDREPWVADLMAGIGMEYGKFSGSYSYIFRTKEFETQDFRHGFGAISISYVF